MRILALDPGATSGWCLYDRDVRRVLEAGKFRGEDFASIPIRDLSPDRIVLERPVAHGPTRPQVVDCAWVAGQLWRDCQNAIGPDRASHLTRLQVKQALTKATLGEVRVVNDATAWAALRLLHGGEGCDRKKTKKHPAGPIGNVTSHERAALAVAVAFALGEVA